MKRDISFASDCDLTERYRNQGDWRHVSLQRRPSNVLNPSCTACGSSIGADHLVRMRWPYPSLSVLNWHDTCLSAITRECIKAEEGNVTEEEQLGKILELLEKPFDPDLSIVGGFPQPDSGFHHSFPRRADSNLNAEAAEFDPPIDYKPLARYCVTAGIPVDTIQGTPPPHPVLLPLGGQPSKYISPASSSASSVPAPSRSSTPIDIWADGEYSTSPASSSIVIDTLSHSRPRMKASRFAAFFPKDNNSAL